MARLDDWAAAMPYLTHRGGTRRRPETRTPIPLPLPGPAPRAPNAPMAPMAVPSQAPAAAAPAAAQAPTVAIQIPPADPRGPGYYAPGGAAPIAGEKDWYTGQGGEEYFDVRRDTGGEPWQQDIKYPIEQYGYPLMNQIMRYLSGADPQYDVSGVNRQLAGARDFGETEMLRMIEGGGANLERRGMGRSSLRAGMEGGLREQFLGAMSQQHLQYIQQAKMQRWQQLVQALGGAGGLSAALAGAKPSPEYPEQEEEGWWDFIKDVAPYVIPIATGVPAP